MKLTPYLRGFDAGRDRQSVIDETPPRRRQDRAQAAHDYRDGYLDALHERAFAALPRRFGR